MTVKQVRKRLFKLIQTIFTETFTQKYNMISSQIPDEQAPSIIDQHFDNANAYIDLLAQNISSRTNLIYLSKIANPIVVYAVYMRYYLTINFIANSPQDTVLDFPSDDAGFIRKIFIDYWPSVLSGLSK